MQSCIRVLLICLLITSLLFLTACGTNNVVQFSAGNSSGCTSSCPAAGCLYVADGAAIGNIVQCSLPLTNTSTPNFTLISHTAGIVGSYGKLPLSFEANRGQTDSRVQFISRGPGYTLFLTSREAVLSISTPDARRNAHNAHLRPTVAKGRRVISGGEQAVVRLQLVGTNREPTITQEDELPGKSNYFIGNDPAKWRTNVPNYAKVRYRDVYPGIDLVYYGNQRRLEHDFVVTPGADPSRIRLRLHGVSKLRLDAGDLVMRTAGGELRLLKPEIYQMIAGKRRAVTGGYVLMGGNRVGFEVAAFDHRQPLVIDPTLSYSTCLGGSYPDEGNGIVVNSSGDAYITGATKSPDFPKQYAYQNKPTSFTNNTAFVTRLSANGQYLVYSTFLGGNGNDSGNGIAVDSSGNAYVTGSTTSTNFPTKNAFQSSNGGGTDAFVTELVANGEALVYSTYLGGSGTDSGNGIAVDSSGNAYVTGQAQSTNFPTYNALYGVYNGGGDAFVVKLAANNGSGPVSRVYCTYLGGGGSDSGNGIAVDSSGNAYVTGNTNSTNFPTSNYFQEFGGNQDAFVTKLAADGQSLIYSTYLGGSDYDYGQGVAVDSSGNAYITGYTFSTDFPTKNPYQNSNKGAGNSNSNAFVTKLAASGRSLVYSTYLGGSGSSSGGDQGNGIAIDSGGNAYITGSTYSVDFPITNALTGQASDNNASNDTSVAFVTEMAPPSNPSSPLSLASLVYSTYLGGNGDGDSGNGIAVDSSGNAYVTGYTGSTVFPTTTNAFQTGSNGDNDVFVTKISAATALSVSPSTLTFTTTVGGSNPAGQQISITGNGALSWSASYTTSWLSLDSSSGTTPSTPYVYANTAALAAGPYGDTITVTVPGAATGSPATVAVTLTVNKGTTTTALQTSAATVLVQNSGTFTATVAATTSGTPTGTVTFKDGTASLGTATLDGGGVASLTVNTLSVGSHSITAAYGGDTNYTGSTSTVLTETVQDFQLVTSGSGASTAVTSATVQAGGTAVYQFQVSPTNGSTFPYAISFSLSGPPVGSTYTITPNPIPTGSGAQTVVVLVQTPLSAGLRRSLGGGMVFAVALLPILNMVRLRRKCRVWCTVLFLLLVILAILGLWGCGGGGSSSQAPRVYGMQFNAASGNLVHSTTLTLTVQ